MRIPSLNQAIQFIRYAEEKNPGPWVTHSFNAAKAAKSIANECNDLDGEIAYILALLHDIGRYEGFKKLHHAISGYNFLNEKGYVDAARIALTHSFVIPDIRCHDGDTDCSQEEIVFIQNYLNNVTYNDYDKLIHMCDAIALPEGLCLMEKRLIDVAMRYGINDFTVTKWKRYLNLIDYFSEKMGGSIYEVLEGVVETTFQFSK